MLTAIAVIGFSLLVFGYFVPSSLPGRFVHTLLSVVGWEAKAFKERNALANYNAAIERRSHQLSNGIGGAGEYDALISSREREQKYLLDSIDTAESRIDVLDSDGVDDRDPRKVRLGGELIRLQERLEIVNGELERYRTTRQSLVGTLQTAAQSVTDGRRKAQELAADLRASEIEQQATAQAMGVDLTSGHDTLSDAERIVQERIDRNRGTAAATRDVLGQGSADQALDARVREKKVTGFLEARRAAKVRGTTATQ
jgi:hypothetical protein